MPRRWQSTCADDVGHPAGEDVIDVDHRVGEQAVHLFGRMLGVQTTSGSEALTDRADRKRGAAQHAEGGIAERARRAWREGHGQARRQEPPDLVEGELLLPDDHSSRICYSGGRFVGQRDGKWPRRIRKDMPPAARFFPESPYGHPIPSCPKENEGMLKLWHSSFALHCYYNCACRPWSIRRDHDPHSTQSEQARRIPGCTLAFFADKSGAQITSRGGSPDTCDLIRRLPTTSKRDDSFVSRSTLRLRANRPGLLSDRPETMSACGL